MVVVLLFVDLKIQLFIEKLLFFQLKINAFPIFFQGWETLEVNIWLNLPKEECEKRKNIWLTYSIRAKKE
jgi:hypothetical protein